MQFTLKTAPTFEPVTMEEAKEHLRLTTDDQDRVLEMYLKSARLWVEAYTGRSLATQTWQASMPSLLWQFELPRAAPLQSVTFVKYYDESNVLQTWSSSNYLVPAFHEPALVQVLDTATWPSTYLRDDAIQVEYVTGYTDGACPDELQLAVLALAGHWYDNREAGVTVSGPMLDAMQALCAPFRLFWREALCQ